jgi:hypothetical protein
MSEPRRNIEIKRRRDTSSVGDLVEIEGYLYRILSADATTPRPDAAQDLDPERGDMIIDYQLEYVRPAPGSPPPPRPAAKPAPASKGKAAR